MKWEVNKERKLAIIRVKGRVKVKPDIRETLNLLRLKKKNNCIVINAEKEFLGMIKKIESFITWGEINKEVFKELVMKRGKISNRRKLDENFIKEKGFKSWDEFIDYIWEDPLRKLKELGIKPVFSLNSPSKGYGRKGIKEFFHLGGALGYRGEKINDLLKRMI